MSKVFLGGTCNGSTWREQLIPLLKVSYFNPVVEDWNEEAQKKEIEERENCDICLYVITPEMSGVYSIAEITEYSIKRPSKTVFAFKDGSEHPDGCFPRFTENQKKSLKSVGEMVRRNGGTFIESGKFKDIADHINGLYKMNIYSMIACFNRGINKLNKKFFAIKVKHKDHRDAEIIINPAANMNEKIEYISNAYNEHLVLKAFSGISIVDYTVGDNYLEIQNNFK